MRFSFWPGLLDVPEALTHNRCTDTRLMSGSQGCVTGETPLQRLEPPPAYYLTQERGHQHVTRLELVTNCIKA